MEKTKANEVLIEAIKHVDWINFALVISSMGEYNFAWGKYDGSKWIPEYEKAWTDLDWLYKNMNDLYDAIKTMRDLRNE